MTTRWKYSAFYPSNCEFMKFVPWDRYKETVRNTEIRKSGARITTESIKIYDDQLEGETGKMIELIIVVNASWGYAQNPAQIAVSDILYKAREGYTAKVYSHSMVKL